MPGGVAHLFVAMFLYINCFDPFLIANKYSDFRGASSDEESAGEENSHHLPEVGTPKLSETFNLHL
jgi:hypothetical protein